MILYTLLDLYKINAYEKNCIIKKNDQQKRDN